MLSQIISAALQRSVFLILTLLGDAYKAEDSRIRLRSVCRQASTSDLVIEIISPSSKKHHSGYTITLSVDLFQALWPPRHFSFFFYRKN